MAKKNKKLLKEIVQEKTAELQAQNNVSLLRENDEMTTAAPKKKKPKKNAK